MAICVVLALVSEQIPVKTARIDPGHFQNRKDRLTAQEAQCVDLAQPNVHGGGGEGSQER